VSQMSQWKWNNVELEVDMEDYDFMMKYNDAFKKLEEEEKEVQKIGSGPEILKAYCDLFYHLFDNIFGDGTANAMFNGRKNSRVCEECYDSFIHHCKKQTIEANRRRSEYVNKYRPNRAQRRASKAKR